ncbi:hypothetical protein NQ317_008630 [Molorchus minor]|uniref:Uncharacterized protein n=1 Tax=Molorchus minor TaxID=1323400 RepID=A0ABQ9K013_9CUCU|nr:hypothetical protein NQ317_008630 [Molorchus minor]
MSSGWCGVYSWTTDIPKGPMRVLSMPGRRDVLLVAGLSSDPRRTLQGQRTILTLHVPANPQLTSAPSSSSTVFATTTKLNQAGSSTAQASSESSSSQFGAAENLTDSSTYTDQTETDFSSEQPEITSGSPKNCVVMGNCIECICGQGAKVTCSPHQCAPAGDEINDYRPPGPRLPLPDVF